MPATEVSIGYGKSLWPELLGEDAETAVSVIERQNPDVTPYVTSVKNESAIHDFSCKRCIVSVNKDGVVVRVPRVA
ncbi:hypothetical protein ACHQM5_005446 [Ranunculus cassubicifolius]